MATVDVQSRLNAVRLFIDNIRRDERDRLKRRLKPVVERATADAVARLVSRTPESRESAEVTGLRSEYAERYGGDWAAYSTSPSERQYGLGKTIKQSWRAGDVDFTGSTLDFVQVSTNIQNTAPHARFAILGEHTASSWDVPRRKLRGGRRAMLWEYNGRPFFKTVHDKAMTVTHQYRINAPRSNLQYLLDEAENSLTIYRVDFERKIIEVIDEVIADGSRVKMA